MTLDQTAFFMSLYIVSTYASPAAAASFFM